MILQEISGTKGTARTVKQRAAKAKTSAAAKASEKSAREADVVAQRLMM